MDNELLSLIGLAESGDEKAFADLTVRYKPLIESMGKRYAAKCSSLIYTEDDFIQEATLGFYSAVRTYRETDKVTFGLYAKVCVRNRLVSLLRASSKRSKKAERIERERGRDSGDVLAGLLGREDVKEIESRIESVLSKFEWSVFGLYIERMSYADIAEALGVSVKSVDNAIYRIKTKIKTVI